MIPILSHRQRVQQVNVVGQTWERGDPEEAKEHEAEVKRLNKQIKSLEDQEKRVLEGWRLGVYRSQEQFKGEVSEVQHELAKAEAERARMKVPAPSLTTFEDLTIGLNEDFLDLLALGEEFNVPKPDNGWVDDALDMILKTSRRMMAPAWQQIIKNLAKRVWVEADGSLTVVDVAGVSHPLNVA